MNPDSRKKPALLALDAGTTNVKAGLFDATGVAIGVARAKLRCYQPLPDQTEHRASELWAAVLRAIDRLLCSVDTTEHRIVAASIAANCPSLLLLDDQGDVINDRVILWMDRRAKEEAQTLWQEFGHPVGPEWPVAKLMWLQRHEPRSLARASRILQPLDFLTYKLTGSTCTSPNHLLVVGYDCRRGTWLEQNASLQLSPALLPPAVNPGTPVGTIYDQLAVDLGLPRGIQLAMGCSDVDASLIGAGCLRDNQACEITGTATVYSAVAPLECNPPPDPLFSYPHPLVEKTVVRGAISAAGASVQWFRDNFARELGDDTSSYQELISEAAAVLPQDLLFVPNLAGKVSTEGTRIGAGLIAGLRLGQTRGHILRALLDAQALQLNSLIRKSGEVGVRPSRILTGGGGAQSSDWLAMKATAVNRPFVRLQTHELSLLGAAILAVGPKQIYSDWEEAVGAMVRVTKTVEPVSEWSEYYEEYASRLDQAEDYVGILCAGV